MSLHCAGPPRNLHQHLETALWAMWLHRSALCRPSPQSLPKSENLWTGGGLVGHAMAWVCVVQALLATSTSTWRRPCGSCGCIGLRCGRPSPQSLPKLENIWTGGGLVGHVMAWVCVVQALLTTSTSTWRWACGPRGGMGLRCAGSPHSLHPY